MHARNHILAAAGVQPLVTVACGFNINPPTTQVKIGLTRTLDIQVPLTEDLSTPRGHRNRHGNPSAISILSCVASQNTTVLCLGC